MKRILYGFLFLLCASPLRAEETAPLRYKITDLTTGLSRESYSSAKAVNNKGEVAGILDDRAFLWRNGKLQFLSPLMGSTSCTPSDLNDKSEIVGVCTFPYGNYRGSLWPPSACFFWKDGKIQGLTEKSLFVTSAKINNSGQVIINAPVAILWQDAEQKILGNWAASAINDKGQIVGARTPSGNKATDSSGRYWAVSWENGSEVSIAGNHSIATFINNKRDIIVEQVDDTEGSWRTRTYLIQSGKEISVIPWGKIIKSVKALNDRCQIVGWISVTPTAGVRSRTHAALWQNGNWHNLNDLLPVNSGWVLHQANDINARGQIVGVGIFRGQTRGFLLTPL